MARKRSKASAAATSSESLVPTAIANDPEPQGPVLLDELRAMLPMLGVIAILAFMIRFFQLGESNLWMDEIVMLKEASAGKYSIISFGTHAAHLVPVEWCLSLLGSSNWALRFWSALLGSSAVPLLALWAGLCFGRRAVPWMGALAATNCFLIMYAQDANYYGGMTFYTAVLLVGMACFYRGAVWPGVGFIGLAAAAGFFNHPVFLLPTGAVACAVLIGPFVFVDLRREMISVSPTDWPRRPFLPLAILLLVAVFFFLVTKGSSIFRLIEPGNSKLTNVSPSVGFLLDEVFALVVNFFRAGEDSRLLLLLPGAAIAASLISVFRGGMRRLSPAAMSGLVLAMLLPVAAYFTLFSLTVQRAYYTRYFIFLVPTFLGLMVAFFGAEGETSESRVRFIFPRVCLGLCVVCSVFFSGRYFTADLSNYDGAVKVLESMPKDERIFVPHRNDLVQADYFVGKAGHSIESPALAYLFEHGVAARYEMPLRALMASGSSPTILSAWREAEAPGLWQLITKDMQVGYRGTSRMGPEYDVVLASAPERMTLPVPLDHFGPLDSIAWPTHQYTSLVTIGGKTALRFERDDRLEFVINQPDESERVLAVRYSGRFPDDPIARKNSTPLPADFLLAVSVDGHTTAVYTIPGGASEKVATIPIALEPGLHRVGLYFTAARLQYTPYFPWNFHGADWRIKGPTDQAPDSVPLSDSWDAMPTYGDPKGGSWSWTGIGEIAADSTLTGLGGDPVVVIPYPADTKKVVGFYAPPAPVTPGTVAAFSYYARWEGLEHGESNGALTFIDKSGRPMSSPIPANGPNFRGTLPDGVWVRRDLVVPVPEGAAALSVGLQIMPIKPLRPTSGGRMWVATFQSPGVATEIADPLLKRLNEDADEAK
ncbi:hypothetical protein GC173_00480 [bacterium]|nr:hypothetical protein [bacterium]